MATAWKWGCRGASEVEGHGYRDRTWQATATHPRPSDEVDGRSVENDDFLMLIGLAVSLDESLRRATMGMAHWLEKEYKLTSNEAQSA